MSREFEAWWKGLPQKINAPSYKVTAEVAWGAATERAAKVCDAVAAQYSHQGGHSAERCAAAIRGTKENQDEAR